MATSTHPLAPYSIWMFYLIAILPGVLFGFFLFMGWSFNRVSLGVAAGKFELKGVFYGRTLSGDELKVADAKLVNIKTEEDLKPVKRMNGLAISQFVYGWFKLKNGEKALIAVSDREHVVYLPTTKGYSVMVSPKDPGAFLAQLKGK